MQVICEKCFSTVQNSKEECPYCNYSFKNKNPQGTLPYNYVLRQRYCINNVIASDSEGTIYSAIDCTTKKAVTVKEFVPVSLCASRLETGEILPKESKEVLFKTTLMDFKELYNMLHRISSSEDGLVAVLDVFDQNNTVYGVCEKINGPTLREYVMSRRGDISHTNAAMLLSHLARSVEALHRHGIVHRGISPDTIFISGGTTAVLGGFATLGMRTQGSELVHKLYEGYAAPEQYSVAEFDGNYTDIYALGAVFYFMLSRKDPVSSQKRKREDTLQPLKNIAKQVPPHISLAIAKAMRLSEVERVQSSTELVKSIEQKTKPATKISSVQKIIIGAIIITLVCIVGLAALLINYAKNNPHEIPVPKASSSQSQVPVISEPEISLVPNLVGELYTEVQNDPDFLGKFHFPMTEKFDNNFKKGEIMEQSPLAGEPIGEDGVIKLVVSAGPKKIVMPNVIGLTREEAKNIFAERNIPCFVFELANDGSYTPDTVVRTNFSEGDELTEGLDEVMLYVAKQPTA